MMPMFINYTVKIDILNKPMLDIYVILSWVDDNYDKNYVNDASVMEVISILWKDELDE